MPLIHSESQELRAKCIRRNRAFRDPRFVHGARFAPDLLESGDFNPGVPFFPPGMISLWPREALSANFSAPFLCQMSGLGTIRSLLPFMIGHVKTPLLV